MFYYLYYKISYVNNFFKGHIKYPVILIRIHFRMRIFHFIIFSEAIIN
jgi:hypothetical protein